MPWNRQQVDYHMKKKGGEMFAKHQNRCRLTEGSSSDTNVTEGFAVGNCPADSPLNMTFSRPAAEEQPRRQVRVSIMGVPNAAGL